MYTHIYVHWQLCTVTFNCTDNSLIGHLLALPIVYRQICCNWQLFTDTFVVNDNCLQGYVSTLNNPHNNYFKIWWFFSCLYLTIQILSLFTFFWQYALQAIHEFYLVKPFEMQIIECKTFDKMQYWGIRDIRNLDIKVEGWIEYQQN